MLSRRSPQGTLRRTRAAEASEVDAGIRVMRGRSAFGDGPAPEPEKRKVISVDPVHWKTKDLELSENALAVLKKRYLKKDERGEAVE